MSRSTQTPSAFPVSQEADDARALSPLEVEVLDSFVALAALIGQPRSIAEIYGLLFISREPLSMGDLIDRLKLSKGSASQGLKFLREVGAIHLVRSGENQRDYYEAETSLKKIVNGYLDRELKGHIASGGKRIESLWKRQRSTDDPDGFYGKRIAHLEQWYKRGSRAVPMLRTFLSF